MFIYSMDRTAQDVERYKFFNYDNEHFFKVYSFKEKVIIEKYLK